MNKAMELKDALVELFRSGEDDYHDADEMERMLEDIDFNALLQGLYNQAEDVYEFHAYGFSEKDLHYYGRPLLPAHSVLLYENTTDRSDETALCSRALELWLLPDMSFAVVSCFAAEMVESCFLTEYRALKGTDWMDAGMDIDFLDLAFELEELCDTVEELNLPIYEL